MSIKVETFSYCTYENTYSGVEVLAHRHRITRPVWPGNQDWSILGGSSQYRSMWIASTFQYGALSISYVLHLMSNGRGLIESVRDSVCMPCTNQQQVSLLVCQYRTSPSSKWSRRLEDLAVLYTCVAASLRASATLPAPCEYFVLVVKNSVLKQDFVRFFWFWVLKISQIAFLKHIVDQSRMWQGNKKQLHLVRVERIGCATR